MYSMFPVGPVIERFVTYTSQLKREKIIGLTPAGAEINKMHELVTCESKVEVVVSLEM